MDAKRGLSIYFAGENMVSKSAREGTKSDEKAGRYFIQG